MSTTTAMMFRSASRRARCLAERVGRDASHMRSRQPGLGSGTKAMFSTKNGDSSGILSESHQFTQYPIPLPALAYAYDYDDDDDDYEYDDGSGSNSTVEASMTHSRASNPLSQQDVNSMISSAHHHHDVTFGNKTDTNVVLASSIGSTPGRGSPSKPCTHGESSSSTTSRKIARGGGGGRHRCPKCGTTVTFRCDFEENTFYCASCSGWFVANPNTIVAVDSIDDKGDGSVYEEFMARNGAKKPEDPKILMRHVSSSFRNNILLPLRLLLLTLVSFFSGH
jgi:predicted RNA-binding Zn-ribbon protein involved in translation (DUF1610 family)